MEQAAVLLDALIEERLKNERARYGEKPIFLSDHDRQRIEKAIGVNVSTPEELVSRIERAMVVSMDGISVHLSPQLLERLRTRAIGMGFERFLPWIIERQLEEYVGLR